MNPKEEIKNRLSIVDVISEYIDLKPSGSSYKGLSPFTQEKTPSFFVSPDKGLFHCFSTNKGGDIFTFVQELEGVDFAGALKILAQKAGVELRPQNPEKLKELDRQYAALEEAANFFESELQKNTEALAYLNERGVTDATTKQFRLGFSPVGWRDLSEHLMQKGFKKETLQAVGLIRVNDKGYFDLFRGRIMFPICDSSGRVIAFSGRLFVDTTSEGSSYKAPKYVNSPDTPLFTKSEVLFGLHHAKHAIRQFDFTILAEGQFDVVLLHEAGFRNAVALSGTALSEDTTIEGTQTVNHVGLVKRLSNNLLIAFDSDSAGIKASVRSAKIALRLGMNVKVVAMPEGTDPADIIRMGGKESWLEHQRKAKHIVLFLLDNVLHGAKDTFDKTKRIVKDVLPLVKMIPSQSEQSAFVQEIASLSDLSYEALWSDLQSVEAELTQDISEDTQTKKNLKIGELVVGIKAWMEENQNPHLESFVGRLHDISSEERFAEYEKKVLVQYPSLVMQIESRFSDTENTDKVFEEILSRFELFVLQQRLQENRIQLARAEREGNEDEVEKLLKDNQEIVVAMDTMKTGFTSDDF